ncbi:MAG: DUF167 domain-containing protein [Victivallaceae bacterium]|nr:DUF167 domain-containing protein [Victivallaceae bacterium]
MQPDEVGPAVVEKPGGCFLKCRVQPGSSRNAVLGVYGQALKIALTARPLDGRANRELLRFLAKYFRLAGSCIRITAGENSRNKTVFISGGSKDIIIRKLCP